MLDLGIQELIVIFGVAIIVFGPKRIPELSRNLGKGLGQLKKALFDVKYEISREMRVLDEEAGITPEEPEPKWKKEALDAIYGGKPSVPGGPKGPGEPPAEDGVQPSGARESGQGSQDDGAQAAEEER